MDETTGRIIAGYQGANAAAAAILAILAGSNPFFAIGEAVYFILQAIGLPSPLEELMSAFSGRPTMEATIDEAKVFNRYSTPVAKLLAAGAADLVRRGIPVSSPSAAPIFGPYFGAAQRVENAIRFGDQSTAHTELTNATITSAMHEAGNPGAAGTATLNALQDAYQRFAGGNPLPGASAYHAVQVLKQQQGTDPASQMSRGWASQYIQEHPGQFPGPPPPPPGGGPPPIPPPPGGGPPPPPPVFHGGGITLSVANGQTVSGAVTLIARLNDYDQTHYPNANLHWFLDGIQIGTGGRVGIITTQHPDGPHHIDVKLIGQRGEMHDELAIELYFHNQPTPPPPPGPPPVPPPPPADKWKVPPLPIPPVPIPGAEGFNLCCEELLAMLYQLVEQVYFIGKTFPDEPKAIDELTLQVNATAHQVRGVVDELVQMREHMPTSGDAASIANAIKCVCDALKGTEGSGFEKIVEQLKRLADEQKKGNDEDLASKELLRALVEAGALTAEDAQLLGSTPRTRVTFAMSHPKITAWLKDHGFLTTIGSTEMAEVVVRLLKSLVEWIEKEGQDIFKEIAPAATSFMKMIEPGFKSVFLAAAHYDTTLPKDIFENVVDLVSHHGHVTPENVEEVALDLFGSAFMVGQGVHLLSELAGYLKYPASSVWKENAELVVEMLAYKEILHSFHGAFYPIAITERARQKYHKQFRPNIPTAAMAHQGFARDKISASNRDTILDYTGRDPQYRQFEQSLAYHPISPRLLANGFRNHAPDPHLLDQVITDQSIEPRFHDLMVQIIDDACYRTVNEAHTSAALSATEVGAMTLDELDAVLDGAGWDAKARGIARQTALINRQKTIAQQTEQAAMTELSGGGITEDQARSLLRAGGVDDWRIDTTVAIGNARAAISAERRIQGEEIRLLRKSYTEEQQAYEAQYLSGVIDEAGLTASLVLALGRYLEQYAGFGTSPEEIAKAEDFGRIELAALIQKLTAKKAGSLVWRYGKQIPRAEVQLLDERVAEIREAYLRNDLTDQQATTDLEGLKIDKAHIRALINRWAQQIAKKGSHPLPGL